MTLTLSQDEIFDLDISHEIVLVKGWDPDAVRDRGFPDEVTLDEDEMKKLGLFQILASRHRND